MKILLVYPRYKYENYGSLQEPLGILYLYSSLRQNNIDVNYIDMTFENDLTDYINLCKDAEIVAFSASTPLIPIANSLASEAKKVNNQIKTVIGGPHITADPIVTLKNNHFDIGVIGEGENTIIELVQNLDKLEKVKGIAFKDNKGDVFINEAREFIQDLDMIPFPARDVAQLEKYRQAVSGFFGLIITRGCPFNCIFCKPMQNRLFGNKYRIRSVNNVIGEIEEMYNRYNIRKIFFKDDDMLSVGTEWLKSFKDKLNENKLKIEWRCQSRVNHVSDESIRLLKESGCTGISFGVESGSQKILNFYRKGTTIPMIENAFKICRIYKMYTHAYIMLGAPEEREEDLKKTYELVKKIKPNTVGISITNPALGTDLHTYCVNNNLLEKHKEELDDYYKIGESNIKLKYLDKEILKKYKQKIYRLCLFRTVKSHFRDIITLRIIKNNPGIIKRYVQKLISI